MVRVTNACLRAEIDVAECAEDNKIIILLLVSNLASQSKVYQVTHCLVMVFMTTYWRFGSKNCSTWDPA